MQQGRGRDTHLMGAWLPAGLRPHPPEERGEDGRRSQRVTGRVREGDRQGHEESKTGVSLQAIQKGKASRG